VTSFRPQRAAGRSVRGRSWLLALLVGLSLSSRAQDSTTLYRDIQRYADRSRFTRWVHGTIFVQSERGEEPPAPGTPVRRTNPLLPYEGRMVRTVDVEVLDPFGNDLTDSLARPTAWIQRAGNSLHRRTREYLVREFVLVKKNEAFDPLEAAESERLLRASPMVNDALVQVVPVNGGMDTVDVRVIVLDKWSIEAWGDISASSGTFTLIDRNLLGLGQELQVRPTVTTDKLLDRMEVQHAVYNIKGTYISTLVNYARTELTERIGLRLDRPFYSPLARWAGGFGISHAWNTVPVTDTVGELLRTDELEPKDLDTWIGRSFPLAQAKGDPARSSAIVAGLRYAGTRYVQRPAIDSTGLSAYPKSDRVLLSLGLSVRQYYRDRCLYRFGAVEDVPEGMLVKLTGGFRDREAEQRLGYTGIEFSRGRHYRHFGYATVLLGYGTFWEKGEMTDATLSMSFRYFSDLFRVERWYLRQFVTLAAAYIDRKSSTERLNINGDQLYGFNSASVSGTHRELLKFETVAYAPYHLLGFRFAPVLLAGFGTIGNTSDPVLSGRIHTSLGLGILIRNENLLVKTFEVSFSFYPYVPEEDGWVFDVGRYRNFTNRLNDFAFTQPNVVGY